MDFVVALPQNNQGYDTFWTLIDRLSKQIILIPGLSTWTAPDWATKYFERVYPQ